MIHHHSRHIRAKRTYWNGKDTNTVNTTEENQHWNGDKRSRQQSIPSTKPTGKKRCVVRGAKNRGSNSGRIQIIAAHAAKGHCQYQHGGWDFAKRFAKPYPPC